MALPRYNTRVSLDWPGNAGTLVSLPVTNLTVTPEPYYGSGGSVIVLFDGRRKMEPVELEGWGYRVVLQWDELGADHAKVQRAIERFISFGPAVIKLSPENTPSLASVIPEITGEELKATFDRRARKHPATLTLLTTSQHLPLYTWLTD